MLRRFKKFSLPRDFHPDKLGNYTLGDLKKLPGIEGHFQSRADFGKDEITGWFLGTKAENMEIFTQLITQAIDNIAYGRRSFHPEDPTYITETVKKSPGYLAAVQSLKDNFYRLTTFLNDFSVPWFSMRYQGHMNWDVTLPSLIGYFTAMLQNQNNVSIQGSTATTFLEIFAAHDIAHMIGYDSSSWSHITCDGTVANIEGLWSAREQRFLPIGIRVALKERYPKAKDFLKVQLGGKEVFFKDLDAWNLLNLSSDEILKIPRSMATILLTSQASGPVSADDLNEKESEIWQCLAAEYSVNALGINRYYTDKEYLKYEDILPPALIVPSSKHYSWPKAAALLGMGHGRKRDFDPNSLDFLEDGLINVYVDKGARMDINLLEAVLNTCKDKRKPVLSTVAVMGSTEESAVDPLKKMIQLREVLRNDSQSPFDFNLHADAAWGGYLISIIRKDFDLEWPEMDGKPKVKKEKDIFIEDTSKIPLREDIIEELKHIRCCDAVTIDPHKWGYIPYPAGSLCYKNGKMVNLVTFGAPYIGSENESEMLSIGESGVEGSKPGAAAAAVFMSHSVIRPSVKGYGKLMHQAIFNARSFYIYVCAMAREEDDFFVVPFNGIPDGPGGVSGMEYIKKTFVDTDKPIEEILEDPEAWSYFKNIGPDQSFVDYIFNFYVEKDGKRVPNSDPQKLLDLHDVLFQKVYPQPKQRVYEYNVMVSKTTFHRDDYGPTFMDYFAENLHLENPKTVNAIPCMRSVVMDPWTYETEIGGKKLNFFRDVIIPTLRQAVVESIKELKEKPKKQG